MPNRTRYDNTDIAPRADQAAAPKGSIFDEISVTQLAAGAMAAVLCGKVDQIILTGGIAYNPHTREILEKHLGFIAPITVYPGEDELLALCQGALRVVTGEEETKEY